jgi:hypothetical protein
VNTNIKDYLLVSPWFPQGLGDQEKSLISVTYQSICEGEAREEFLLTNKKNFFLLCLEREITEECSAFKMSSVASSLVVLKEGTFQ